MEQIRISINLLCIEGVSEKLWHIHRSHKIRSFFYTKNTLPKLLCKRNDKVAMEDKNNTIYEIGYSNCEAVYFGKSKCSLKLPSNEHKISVKICDCEMMETAKHCWEANHNFSLGQKKVVDWERRLIPWKIKEAIYSFRNPNHIYKVSYVLPEIHIPNLT